MSRQIVVPQLGESIVDATIARWRKHEGDPVAIGDILLELETEKVTLEVGSEFSGVLTRVLKPDGTDVKVGEPIGELEEGAGTSAELPQSGEQQDVPTALHVEKKDKGRGKNGNGQSGATQTKDAPAAEAPPAGAKAGAKAAEPARKSTKGGGIEARPAMSDQGPREPAIAAMSEPPEPQQRVHAGDSAHDGGAAPVAGPSPEPAHGPEPSPAQLPPPGAAEEDDARIERVRMTRRRRTIARNLVEAQQSSAMLTTFNEIDMKAVMELRARHKEAFQKRHGVGLGMTSFFVKAVVSALAAYPDFNAELDGDEIVYKHYYDIGVAIDSPGGLVVPVLREADQLGFAAIEQAIRAYVKKAEDGTLALDDLRGGCFSITNGGVFGSLFSTPILNMPQVGILGLHKVQDRPVAVGGQVVVHPVMIAALTYDHRLIDGRTAVLFLRHIKELIEDPGALLLEG